MSEWDHLRVILTLKKRERDALNQVEQLQKETDAFREVLEWYAHPETYKRAGNGIPVVLSDEGYYARDVLQRYSK